MQIIKELEANEKKAVKLTAENLEKYNQAEAKKEAEVKVETRPEVEKKDLTPKKLKEEVKKIAEQSKQERKKPAWTLTEKQAEEQEEQDVDELLEFAYQLDYEKYIEDFEIRQALSVLKERVQELKQDENWKENFVARWNQQEDPQQEIVHTKEHLQRDKDPQEGEQQKEKLKEDQQREDDEKEDQQKEELKSTKSKSVKSQAKSVRSVVDTIKDMEKKQKEEKPEWDKSVKEVEKISVEEKAARQIAEQVLENAPYLKGIHSKASMQQILIREARAQLAKKPDPLIVTIKDGGKCRNVDPSNLPYLHRNEAI